MSPAKDLKIQIDNFTLMIADDIALVLALSDLQRDSVLRILRLRFGCFAKHLVKEVDGALAGVASNEEGGGL